MKKEKLTQKMVEDVREAHLRAFLRGESLITPLELRAVVRAAVEARENGYRPSTHETGT